MEKYREIIKEIEKNVTRCLLGKQKEVNLLLTALFANGHVLLEGVPGTGKTMLVKAVAKTISGNYRRVQCNPDLLPSDVTGFSMYHPNEKQFIFKPGPVMANILLVDEINRAATKTQSALLEAMEEKQVSVDGENYPLPTPFFVMATQNPIEFEGTYLLPEAQLDRFMMKFPFGYPDKQTERNLLISQSNENPIDLLEPVTTMEQIIIIQQQLKDVHIDENLVDYLLEIGRKTRENDNVLLGVSPRATISLLRCVKAFAFIEGRNYVIPDDIKYLAPFVFCHRMIVKPEVKMNKTEEDIILDILESVKVPIG